MIGRLSFRTKQILIGLIFIGIGVGYLGDQMKWWEFTIFFPGWWTMFLIIPAIIGIIDYGFYIANMGMLLFGCYFLANANGWIDYKLSFPIFVAIGCICIGIRLLFRKRVKWYDYTADGYKD
ncbi:LiaF transmembrane domain-containing protein [Amedibacillus sp. YH-ame10]